ncbi:MAG TPA: sigma-70 family RNA polymerase sigma factor [Planctomycetota bacterium]
MGAESQHALRDELPAHAAWVRRLARSLVRDEAAADDLAQETALAALELEQRPAALRPWLVRVTRNFARRGWRARARRSARERAVARPEAVPGADESAARLELERRLVDELARLEPAVRHALVRRYLEGWSAARIARETGEPAATVRWRLQRGLAELRARLDRAHGGDGVQWRLALLPLCEGAPPWADLADLLRSSTGASLISGVLTMKTASQALVAAALAVALGLGAWWTLGREPEPRAAEPVAQAELAPTPERATVEPVTPDPAQREVAPATPREHAAEPAPPPAVAGPPRAEGRCVDERLVPIGFARVSQVKAAHATEAHADGTFALELTPQRGTATLLVEAAGFASRFVELSVPPDASVALGDVALAPGGAVRGRVLGPDGTGFPGAKVTVTSPELWGTLEQVRTVGPRAELRLETRSGADGRFELAGLALGPARAWAGAEGMRFAVSAPLEVRPDGVEVELVLEPMQREDRITGIVLSPTGEPVPGAGLSGMVRLGGGGQGVAYEAGPDGRFEIVARARHVYDLEVVDPLDRWAHVPARGLRPGTHGLELRFQEARWIDVRVRAPEGHAPAGCEVLAENDDGQLERIELEPGAPGRLRVPGAPFRVRAEARGFAPALAGPFAPAEAPAELALELVPEPGVRGRVLADGAPLAGAVVSLHRHDSAWRIEHRGYPCLVSPHGDDETRTDSDGRFTLHLRRAGTYLVRAEAEGWAARESELLALDPTVGRDGLELVLGPGGVLEGRVRLAPGRDPAGVIVAVNRGDARPRTVRSGPDGSFRFEGLMAGPWQLLRGPQEVTPGPGGSSFSSASTLTVIAFNCTIRDGETTRMDLDLTDFEPCTLRGTLLVNGAPARDWGATAWPGAKESMVGTPPSTAVAGDGSFTLVVDEAGPLRLSFTAPAELGGAGRIDARLEVRPGANDWRADFAMGRLSGRFLSGAPDDGRALFYVSGEGVEPSCWLPLEPDAEGRFAVPFAPAGQGSIRAMEGFGGEWLTLLQTDVPRGGERVVDVP